MATSNHALRQGSLVRWSGSNGTERVCVCVHHDGKRLNSCKSAASEGLYLCSAAGTEKPGTGSLVP